MIDAIPTPRWPTLTLQTVLADGGLHIDLLFDLAKTGPQPWVALPNLRMAQQKLLQGTAHEEAVDEGPALVRYHLQQTSDCVLLAAQLASWDEQEGVMLLQSRQPFSLLAARLQYFALASWNNGTSHGVLRYYNRALFRTVLEALNETEKTTLLAAASQWHWQDRDGKAQHILAVEAVLAWPAPDTPLLLGEAAVQRLNCWHESELYVQQYLPTPQQTASDSQEAMLQKVFRAQMAADRAGLYSPQERDAFVARQLCVAPSAAS